MEGDFRKMSKSISSNSVSLIFTDPPYDGVYLWVYKPLGKIAPGPENWRFAYLLHQSVNLFEIGDMLRESELKHWGTFYIKLKGPPFARLYDHQFTVRIKPLLWFVKGSRPSNPTLPKPKESKKKLFV